MAAGGRAAVWPGSSVTAAGVHPKPRRGPVGGPAFVSGHPHALRIAAGIAAAVTILAVATFRPGRAAAPDEREDSLRAKTSDASGSQNVTPPFVLVLANGRSILGDAANGRVFRAVATVCVVSVGVLALAVVVLRVLGKD